MDIEKIYPIGSNDETYYRLAIGWSDTEQEYYARLETDAAAPEIIREYSPSTDGFEYSLAMLVAHLRFEVNDLTGNRELQISYEDMEELTAAPKQRLVDPSEIEVLDMSDTDYAVAPIYGSEARPETFTPQQVSYEEFLQIIDNGRDTDLLVDDAPLEDLEQTVQDCYSELQTCVSCLKSFSEAASNGSTTDNNPMLNNQCNSAISFAALQLIEINQSLFMSFTTERIEEISNAVTRSSAAMNEIFTADEIDRINAVTVALCGSKLTDFRKAVEVRLYDPVTGLPLNCDNFRATTWADVMEDIDVEVYEHFGLSTDEGEHMIAIERIDPRYRNDDDWDFATAMTLKMKAVIDQRHQERE